MTRSVGFGQMGQAMLEGANRSVAAEKAKKKPNQLIFNPRTGQYESQGEAPLSPYQTFQAFNQPKLDEQVSGYASNLISDQKPISYAPKTAADYIPQETLGQLGQVTQKIADYTPEKVEVAKVQSLPVEYYQKQIDDLTAPLKDQYQTSRALLRGDQAARGVLNDSEAFDERIPTSTGNLDKRFLEQIGNITRGVELQRMTEGQQNERDFITNSINEAENRRKLALEGINAGNTAIGNTAQLYGNLGQSEQDRAVTTALQQAGLDANTINSLLGYGADRYKTEAGLFGDIYGEESSTNRSMIEDQQRREQARREQIINLLDLQGYQGVPQEQLFNEFLNEFGYRATELSPESASRNSSNQNIVNPGQSAEVGQGGAPTVTGSQVGETVYFNNLPWRWNGMQWTRIA